MDVHVATEKYITPLMDSGWNQSGLWNTEWVLQQSLLQCMFCHNRKLVYRCTVYLEGFHPRIKFLSNNIRMKQKL